jgi:hypothetical protein
MELLYNPAGIGCIEDCMLKEAYSMNTLLVPAEQTAVSRENQSAVNSCSGSPKFQREDVSYEHEGYLIRVHFNGNKTLTQCIRNLAERRIEG